MNDFSEFDKNELVIRQIDDAYVVWFANGNQYLKLEEPAFFVFQSLENRTDKDILVDQCAERYQVQKDESRQFVMEICSRIESIKRNPVGKKSGVDENQKLQTKPFSPFSIHEYMVGGKPLRFYFENQVYERYLHPLLQHLETEICPNEPTLFELFGYNDRIVLRVNRQIKGIWTRKETHLLKGMAFLQILNAVYKKDDHDWMAVIHASAVTNGAKTIVFPASPGSGKSTIAALLQQKGFSLVSDDFVPIERITQHVFPFPAAISVKEGATDLLSAFYPSLRSHKTQQRSTTNKLVRYLPVDGRALPAPVKEIIFIKYDPAIDFEMKKLSRTDALEMLLDETWTSPSAENAGRFLDWYSGLSCYRLSYSDNEKTLQTIIKLFEQ